MYTVKLLAMIPTITNLLLELSQVVLVHQNKCSTNIPQVNGKLSIWKLNHLLFFFNFSLESANASLVEELRAKEMEYETLQQEVQDLSEKVDSARTQHSKELGKGLYSVKPQHFKEWSEGIYSVKTQHFKE